MRRQRNFPRKIVGRGTEKVMTLKKGRERCGRVGEHEDPEGGGDLEGHLE